MPTVGGKRGDRWRQAWRSLSGTVDHAVFAEQLRERRYMGWVSLEMREGHPFDRASFRDSVSWFEQCYGRDAAAISVRGMHGSQPEEMPVPRWER